MKSNYPESYGALLREDGIIENLQATLYLASSILAVLTAMNYFSSGRKRTSVYFWFLAAFASIVFFEEVSWGQRVFGLESPDLFKTHNYQSEISIHNLNILQSWTIYLYTAFSGFAAFGWIIANRANFRRFPLFPPLHLSFYFLIPFLVCIQLLAGRFGNGELAILGYSQILTQEPCELLLSLGVFFWILIAWRSSRSQFTNGAIAT